MQVTTPNLKAETAAIKSVLDSYVKAVETEDLGLYERLLDHDPNMVNFGTDASERILGWSELRKAMRSQFNTLKGARITASNVTVTLAPEGRFAWATSSWVFRATLGTQAIKLPVRCSWVLEKRNGRWVIVHFHKSVGTTS